MGGQQRNSDTSSAPALSLTTTSNLVLLDANSRVLWTTNAIVGAVNSSAASGLAAVLLNTGNLVIRYPNGTSLWQSFDHPSDTFLPSMKIRLRYKTQADERLVSWTSPNDPSPGTFSYGPDPATLLQIILCNGTRPIARNGPWTCFMVDARSQLSAGLFTYSTFLDNGEELYTTYSLSDGAPPTRFVLTYSGEYHLESWRPSGWTIIFN